MNGTLAKRAVTSVTCYAQLGIIAGPQPTGVIMGASVRYVV